MRVESFRSKSIKSRSSTAAVASIIRSYACVAFLLIVSAHVCLSDNNPLRAIYISWITPKVVIQTSAVHAHTGDRFVCATLDWWPPQKCDYGSCSWGKASILNLNLKAPELFSAMKALSPFILRIGGSLQDHIVYDVGSPRPMHCPPINYDPSDHLNFVGGCLMLTRWKLINDLCTKAGCEIAFGLNALYGRKKVGDTDWVGNWSSINAKALIKWSWQNNYPIHSWQLGNEVGGVGGIAAHIPAADYASDLQRLRKIIDDVYEGSKKKPLLSAADNYYETAWYSTLFEKMGPGILDIVTRHNYFLGAGVDANLVEKILSPSYLSKDQVDYETAWNGIHSRNKHVQLWIGESGGAYNSGKNTVTNSFVSGFWYLDQLGTAARYNHSVHCRQTLVGGNYGLLNTSTFVPNPDFYSALFFSKLMGSRVLQAVSSGSPNIRSYAHCLKGASGPVSLLLLNLDPKKPHNVSLALQAQPHSSDSLGATRSEFHFTAKAGNIHSQATVLNGRQLSLAALPAPLTLWPLAVERRHSAAPLVEMAPLSYAFVVFRQARVGVCV